MLKSLKRMIFIMPVILTAFSPIKSENIKTEYYYNLRFLKQSDAPQYITMIRIDNVAYQKSILERGILITYKNRNAKSVRILGDFSNWKSVKMNRGKYGVWYHFINILNNNRIRYKLQVDGICIMDPQNYNREDDLNGSYVSVLTPVKSLESRHIPFRFIDKNTVEFRLYKPDAKLVAIVGDFNGWNPENDLLIKDSEGFWRIKKRLFKGMYRYKYIIDGEWAADMFNQNSESDNIGSVCSVIKVK